MLIYNQAYDFYHSIFRMLQLTTFGVNNVQIEKIRILDFYIVFPWKLLDIPKKMVGFRKYEKMLREECNPYDNLPNVRQMFIKMAPFQYQAIKVLVSSGFFDKAAFDNGLIKRTDKELPEDLKKDIQISNENKKELLRLLSNKFSEMSLYGAMGLKARTGLMDFKYDETIPLN